MRQETLRPLKRLIDAQEISATVTVEEVGDDGLTAYLSYKILGSGKTRDRIRVPQSAGYGGV
jgi:hypothetical protein